MANTSNISNISNSNCKRISFDSYDYVLLNTFEIENLDVEKGYNALMEASGNSLELILVRDSHDEIFDIPGNGEEYENYKHYKNYAHMYKQMFDMDGYIYRISSALIRVNKINKINKINTFGPTQIMGQIVQAWGENSECSHSTLGATSVHREYVMTIKSTRGDTIRVLGIYTDTEAL